MKTKAPLPKGEMWRVRGIIEPLLGYGAIKYIAYSMNDHFEKGSEEWANEIEFYCTSKFDMNHKSKFVIWSSAEDMGTIKTSALVVGLTEFVELDILSCSRWVETWPYWPKS